MCLFKEKVHKLIESNCLPWQIFTASVPTNRVCVCSSPRQLLVYFHFANLLKNLLLPQSSFAALIISLCSEFVISFSVDEFCPTVFCIAESANEIPCTMKIHTFVSVNSNRVQSMFLCHKIILT